MAITNGYCTLSELKAALGISDTTDDARLERAVEGASRRIDGRTRRRFYADADASARVFEPTSTYLCPVDDISTTSGLIVKTDDDGDGVYEHTWTVADYELRPLNASALGEPWNLILGVDELFPTPVLGAKAPVEVTARWGWASVPVPIREACIMLSARMFRRADSPLGVLGFGDLGAVRVGRLDPDIDELVAPFVLMRGIVG